MPSLAPRLADPLGLADPARYRLIRRQPLLDAHSPIPKLVFDPAAVSAENPRGLVRRMIGATLEDLEIMATNGNRRAMAGDLRSAQLGHAPLTEVSEGELPKAVGFVANYAVGELAGRPCLFGDLAIATQHYAEASSYPRLSIERVGFDDPGRQAVEAVALIRRRPERDLGVVAYSATGPAELTRVHYSRDVGSAPFVAIREAPAERTRRERQAKIDAIGRAMAPGEAGRRVAEREALELRRRQGPTPSPAERTALIDWCARKNIRDLSEGKRRRAGGET